MSKLKIEEVTRAVMSIEGSFCAYRLNSVMLQAELPTNVDKCRTWLHRLYEMKIIERVSWGVYRLSRHTDNNEAIRNAYVNLHDELVKAQAKSRIAQLRHQQAVASIQSILDTLQTEMSFVGGNDE